MATRQPKQRTTILLVEDEPLIAMATAQTITRFGYEVVTAHTGEQAVTTATENPAISLILMDINLGPGIDGTEAARQILAIRHLPIVFLSSHTEEEYVSRVREITRYGYVVKSSGDFVLKSSLDMAFELFTQYQKTRESEEQYRTLVETLHEGIWQIDKDNYTTYVNAKMANILGYSVDDMMGKHLFEFMDNRGRELCKEQLNRRRRGIAEQHDFEFLRKDGSRVSILMETGPIMDKDGNYQGALATIMDITDRKKMEAALRESEQRFRTLFRKHHAVMLLIDPDSGAIIDANDAAQRFYGYSLETLRNMFIHDINTMPPEEIAARRQQAAGEEQNCFIFPHRVSTGVVRMVEVHSSPLTINGQCILFSIIHDITERKQAEEALKHAKEALQEANDTKDTFFSIIAHDLKNPLLAFQSGTELLAAHLKESENESVRFLTTELHKRAQHVNELLEKLLTWARMQQGAIPYHPESLDLASVVPYTVNLVREQAARKQIAVTCMIAQETTAFADSHMVTAVVRNLLTNAIKFTREGGTITITSHDAGEFLEIAISDNGVGMTSEQQQKLFRVGEKNITRLGTAGEIGTGLGLLLCKEFVERHGGRIWVESEVGAGSTFTFTLPKSKI